MPKPSGKPSRLADVWALLFLTLLAALLFLPGLLRHQALFSYDLEQLGLPLHQSVLRSLAAHEWPLWMPELFGGMPLLASCNLQFLYPTDFVAFLCGRSMESMLYPDAILNLALAGAGMWFFLRRLRLGASASLLGAVFFLLSGSLLSQVYGGFANYQQGYSLIPWAFWACHKAAQERSLFIWGLCGLVLALQILAGALQPVAYLVPALACFAYACAKKGPRPAQARGLRASPTLAAALGFGFALLLAALIAAPQLWPTLQYYPYSDRSAYTGTFTGSFDVFESITWFVPGFYGWKHPTYHGYDIYGSSNAYLGLLPWALASAALATARKHSRLLVWMAGLALLSFLFSLGDGTPLYHLILRLPVYSGFRMWNRILVLFTFALCVLAAQGWDSLADPARRAQGLRGLRIFSLFALAMAVLAWSAAPASALAAVQASPSFGRLFHGTQGALQVLVSLARDSAWTCAGLACLLLLLFPSRTPRLHPWALLALALGFHLLDQSSLLTRSVRFVGPGSAQERPDDVDRLPSTPSAAYNAPIFDQPLPAPPGVEPWRVADDEPLRRNQALLWGYENVLGWESMPMTSSQSIRKAMAGRTQDWLDLLNVRYVFSHSDPGGSVMPGDHVRIRENKGALPRARMLWRFRRVRDDAEAYRLLADPAFDPRREAALDVDPGLPAPPAGPDPVAPVTWLARTPHTCSLELAPPRPGILLLSNTWYPAWRARVDGVPVPLLKADGGLQALVLDAGRHRVDLAYDQGLFQAALWSALAGLLLLLALGVRGLAR